MTKLASCSPARFAAAIIWRHWAPLTLQWIKANDPVPVATAALHGPNPRSHERSHRVSGLHRGGHTTIDRTPATDASMDHVPDLASGSSMSNQPIFDIGLQPATAGKAANMRDGRNGQAGSGSGTERQATRRLSATKFDRDCTGSQFESMLTTDQLCQDVDLSVCHLPIRVPRQKLHHSDGVQQPRARNSDARVVVVPREDPVCNSPPRT